MTVMAFDRARLEILRTALDAALEDLHLIRSDDVHAAEAMRCVRSASRTLGDTCIPRVHDILTSTAMTWYKRAGAACDNATEAALVTARERRWEMVNDPLSGLGPPSPACRTFDEVLHQMRSGTLTPMSAPIDADGRALAHYTSLTFEPGTQPGEVRVLRGRGMPVLQGFGRGDHRVLVNVRVPHRLTDDQRRLLNEFEQASDAGTYHPPEGFFDKLKSAFR